MLHFTLIYELISSAYPHLRNGLLPALFIVPYAFGVVHLIKKRGVVPASGDARLAWQGGAALLFVSLIFPHPIRARVDHARLGDRRVSVARALPIRATPRAAPCWNCAALRGIRAARAESRGLRIPPARRGADLELVSLRLRHHLPLPVRRRARGAAIPGDSSSRASCRDCSTCSAPILTFLLLNIEIADYFSIGPTLTFSFTGNFARDMTYSIAWALFALALLLVGMRQKTKWVRYAGLALLLVTLAEVVPARPRNLGPLYRIGAFIGVAVILIVASFVYQRFLAPAAETARTD